MAILRDTQRFLHFNLSHTANAGEDNHYVDLAKLLSQANRRFYRQGMVYHVANIVFDDADGDADIDVCTMPQNWTTQAAWATGFKHWLTQQRAALDALGWDELPAWQDFKIYLDAQHRGETADLATLIDVNGNTFSSGDWDYSKYQINDDDGTTDEAVIQMMGDHSGTAPSYTVVSLLMALEQQINLASRSALRTPQPDAEAETVPWGYMSSVGNADLVQEVIEDMEADNDYPPYSPSKIMGADTAGAGEPSSPWVARTCMIKGGSNTSSPVAAVGGFAVPCGLIMIETNAAGDYSTNSNSIGCTIELVPGEYKGVHAYPMRGGGF